ncbi:MAG: hypothetical protein ACPG5T_07240 [Endozoicomonas sp.]
MKKEACFFLIFLFFSKAAFSEDSFESGEEQNHPLTVQAAHDWLEDCPREGCGAGTPVMVDPRGWWFSGIISGRMAAHGWKEGFIWQSGELEIHSGDQNSDGKYPFETYALSVEADNVELWERVSGLELGELGIFRYRSKAFWSNPFSTGSGLILESIPGNAQKGGAGNAESRLTFNNTASYVAFPKGAEVSWNYQDVWSFREKQVKGLVIRVQRKSRGFLANLCVMKIHLGGTRLVARTKDDLERRRKYNRETGVEETEYRQVTRTEHVSKPNVGHFYTYEEDLCRYGEDAARTGREVNVVYSDFWDSKDRLVDAELFKIGVSNQK